jgi:hypothetical protein
MAGDEVGVKVRLDYVSDSQAVAACLLQVGLDVALRVNHGGEPVRTNQVRSVGETA